MINKDEFHANNLKLSVDDIIGIDTTLKRRKKTEDDIQREKFEKLILMLETVEIRSTIMAKELGINFSQYDESFFDIIDVMMDMHFGKEANEVIFFYLYDRKMPDGSINELQDEDNKPIPLNTPTDLWLFVKQIELLKKSPKKK